MLFACLDFFLVVWVPGTWISGGFRFRVWDDCCGVDSAGGVGGSRVQGWGSEFEGLEIWAFKVKS